jgi:hypothetical protein
MDKVQKLSSNSRLRLAVEAVEAVYTEVLRVFLARRKLCPFSRVLCTIEGSCYGALFMVQSA